MSKSKLTIISLLAATMAFSVPVYAEDVPDDPDPPTQTKKGDNGWGNGADTTNAGSFSGGTSSSKSTNGGSRDDRNYPSALDRFEGR
ncbi:hypothetical protein [Ruegeria conchae]|uniref:hypothetical protein n=1 Tax=Ruegeria conchae TaxID=981384 RepID=UPI00111202F5|nr:hypothetical protein [Ruegeria conchae]UWR02306.1 hypothetical protein K3740_14745 [Ruegeria conchae]